MSFSFWMTALQTWGKNKIKFHMLNPTGACSTLWMGHPSQWRTTSVIQRRCPWGPERADCHALRTASSVTGAPGATAAWWDMNPDQKAAAQMPGLICRKILFPWSPLRLMFLVKNAFSHAEWIQSRTTPVPLQAVYESVTREEWKRYVN